ncbi:MAG: helix-turn-helix domain-containing protein [Erythrobacter sp.]
MRGPQDTGGLSGGGATHARFTLTSEFRAAPEPFAGCFTSIYHMTLDVHDHGVLVDYLQPEWGNVRFFAGSAPNAAIGSSAVSGARFVGTGPSALPCRFTLGTSRMWGIGFLPLGWARFFKADASSLANVVCDGARHPAFARFTNLSDALREPSASLDEQFTAIIAALESLMRPTRDDARIGRVHEAIVSGQHASVHELADASAMSVRTLERVCLRYFGFAPKLLIRRQRFMRSLTNFMLHDAARWTEAMDEHYHDQAQFTREFHEFMTMNPSEYAALDHPILASFMEARARIWGSAAQTLDPPRR